jgi:hypothetical protein
LQEFTARPRFQAQYHQEFPARFRSFFSAAQSAAVVTMQPQSRSRKKIELEETMRNSLTCLLFATLLMPTCGLSQQNGAAEVRPDQGAAKFIGVWRGSFDNLPGVEMVITDDDGQLHGAILFYFHQRRTMNSPYSSTPGLPEPMFDLRRDGDLLHFNVSHRRAHPPGSLHDEPKAIELKLTGPDRAELINKSEGAPVVEMKRSDY